MPMPRRGLQSPNSQIKSLQMGTLLSFFTPSMLKDSSHSFEIGDLVCKDSSTGYLKPFTATTSDSGDTWDYSEKVCGIVNGNYDENTTDARVCIMGTIKGDYINVGKVSQTSGTDFTLNDFVNLANVEAAMLDEYSFGNERAINLYGISE